MRWRRAVAQAWSIATGKTCLWLRRLLRFQARSRLFDRRAQTTSVPPGAEAFTAGPVSIPATASAAAVRTTVPVPADVSATAPDVEALTRLAACLECGGENLQPLLSHPFLTPPQLPGCLEYGSKTRL